MTTINRLWRSPRFRNWGIPILILLIAFILRVIYPISRPLVWSDRAFHFIDAILEQDWPSTFQRYHPGVTIMWLAGIPLHIFAWLRGGLNADQMLGVAQTPPGTLIGSLQAAVIPIALVISLCIALMYTLLRRLANWRIAGVAAMLLALDPFHIGYSKVLHPDALLATFMMVSALAMLLYLKEGRWPILILSGLFAGLSFLSKSPSLFLIPYTGLAITSAAIIRWKRDQKAASNSSWEHMAWMVVRTALVWTGIAATVFILLWPVMWVRPLDTLVEIYNGIVYHGSDPHPNPVFFNGQTYETDPGLGFYLATIGWKTTIITLPFVIIGIFFSVRRDRSAGSWLVWALATYVFFFFLQMGLSDYKQVAYILPVFPALDIIAGIGIVWSAEWLAKASGKVYASGAFIAVILGVQVAVTLFSYPYFSAHYNRLLGGTVVAQNILPLQDQGEGLEIAARYLNEIPHGQDETAMIYKRSAIVFQREFAGRTETNFIPWATYRVYYVNQIMRELGDEEWHEAWQADLEKEPLLTVDVNGVTFVWVYGDRPEDPINDGTLFDVEYYVGDHIQLTEARLSDLRVEAGDTLSLVLLWEADDYPAHDYVVFSHLLSSDNDLVAQQDNVPLQGIRPTSTWRPSEELEDLYRIQVDPAVEPGIYTLSIGMYDPSNLERIPTFDRDGIRLPEDRIIIADIEVAPATASDG